MKLRALIPLTLCLLSVPAASAAEPALKTEPAPESEPRYPWRFHRFDAVDYTVTAVSTAGLLYVQFGLEPAEDAKWTSTYAIDDRVRGWLRARTPEGRRKAALVSDILWFTPMALSVADLAFPIVAGNGDTTWQMSAITIEAYAVAAVISRGTHRLVARERPDVSECHADPEYSDACFLGETSSYISGHTSASAVGSGLVCSHHLSLGLFGSELADGLSCATAITMTLGTGTARIIADRHHVTDVLSGAVVGFGAGLALPLLRHYREAPRAPSDQARLHWTVVPTTQGADGFGVAAHGWFR